MLIWIFFFFYTNVLYWFEHTAANKNEIISLIGQHCFIRVNIATRELGQHTTNVISLTIWKGLDVKPNDKYCFGTNIRSEFWQKFSLSYYILNMKQLIGTKLRKTLSNQCKHCYLQIGPPNSNVVSLIHICTKKGPDVKPKEKALFLWQLFVQNFDTSCLYQARL